MVDIIQVPKTAPSANRRESLSDIRKAVYVAATDTPDELKVYADYTCDGTGDQVEINNALNDGSFDEVYLMQGNYTLSDSIVVPSNMTLRGDADSLITCPSNFISTATYRQTYLNYVSVGTITQGRVYSLIVTAVDADNVKLIGLNVDGNGDSISNVLMANILIDQASNVLIEDCTSTNCALTIDVNDATDGAFCLLFTTSEHCVVRGGRYTLSGYECIGTRDGSYDILIEGAYCGGAVVHVAQSEGNEELGNSNNRASRIIWQNCTFDQANFGSGYSNNGFMCHSAEYVTVANCSFLDSSLAVICASSHINYIGNTITGSEGCIIIQEQDAWSTPYAINVVGNVCKETDTTSGNHPVAIDGGKQINVSDNIIDVIYQGKDGIICYNHDIDGITISNNIIRGTDATNLPFNGINFNANGSKNVAIIGNQVMGSNAGVQINTTTTGILVEGNKCLTGCAKGIYVTGGSTSNLIKNNNVVQCSSTKLTYGATDTVYDNIGASDLAISINDYTSSGSSSLTIPSWAKLAKIIVQGAGGGGGSGRNGASAIYGGGGGGGGARAEVAWDVANLTAGGSLTIVVGSGGTGGASQTSNNSNGNAGSAGGASYVSDSTDGRIAYADGGSGGSGGTGSNGTGGSGGTGMFNGATGGNGGAGTNVSTVGGNAQIAGGGGGGGGGWDASFNQDNGSAGGKGSVVYWQEATAAAGASGSELAGTSATTPIGPRSGGGGGGSGPAATTTHSYAGAVGKRGGGGAGGGGGFNGFGSSAGGDGGAGFVRVVFER